MVIAWIAYKISKTFFRGEEYLNASQEIVPNGQSIMPYGITSVVCLIFSLVFLSLAWRTPKEN